MASHLFNRSLLAVATALAAAATLASVPASSQAATAKSASRPAVHTTTATSARPAAARRTPDHYTPHTGVTYNNPLGNRKARRRNLTLLLRSIDSSPRGSEIRIATWNLRSPTALRKLRAAAVRGVSVHVSISSGNDKPGTDTRNPAYDKFKGFLRNLSRKRHLRGHRASWARVCYSSCRSHKGGKHAGISHTKFYLFSKVGHAKDVAIYGSANLTDLAAGYQWNDLYTSTDPRFYTFMSNIFRDMQPEHSQEAPFREATFGNLTMQIFPDYGPGSTPNPALTELDKISCFNPGSVGISGHTKIRIAQTALLDTPGVQIARKLKQLRILGCNIELLYAEVGPDVNRILKSGHVPAHQMIQDFNHDGVFDRYIHTKVLTISGNYDGVPNTQVAFNGSHNWTQVSLDSDDSFAEIRSAYVVRTYDKYTEHWFAHGPRANGNSDSQNVGRRTVGATGRAVNPYSKIQLD